MRRSHFLALAAQMALLGCSRAQKPAESVPAPNPTSSLPAPTLPGTSATQATPAQIETAPAEAPTLIASAPHPPAMETNAPAATPPPAAIPASGLTLHLLVPAGHAPAWLAEELQSTLGAKVSVATYDTDAECDAALSAPGAAYDLVGITDRYAADMIGQQKLRPLPADVAPLAAQPSAEFLHHYFDPHSTYTWPYG
jgi:spermidine/putrescine-binding protein